MATGRNPDEHPIRIIRWTAARRQLLFNDGIDSLAQPHFVVEGMLMTPSTGYRYPSTIRGCAP